MGFGKDFTPSNKIYPDKLLTISTGNSVLCKDLRKGHDFLFLWLKFIMFIKI